MTSTALERVEAADVEERKRINRVLVTADVMAGSSLLRQDLRNNPGNSRAIALTLDQLGVPVTINNMNACFVINGAVGMMTWLWCAVATAVGGHEVWLDEASDAEKGIAHLRRADTGAVRTVVFTIADAQRAGLTTGANKHNYEKFATDMLGWRALSRVVKRYAPEVMAGLAATGVMPGPASPRGEYLFADDDEVVDAELVNQGATTPPPTPEAEDPDEWAAFVAWKRAGEPRDEDGRPVDVPPAAADPEGVGDNGTARAVVGAPSTAPPLSGPALRAEVLARAAELGQSDATLVKMARQFAGELGIELPRSIDQVTDEALMLKLDAWLG